MPNLCRIISFKIGLLKLGDYRKWVLPSSFTEIARNWKYASKLARSILNNISNYPTPPHHVLSSVIHLQTALVLRCLFSLVVQLPRKTQNCVKLESSGQISVSRYLSSHATYFARVPASQSASPTSLNASPRAIMKWQVVLLGTGLLQSVTGFVTGFVTGLDSLESPGPGKSDLHISNKADADFKGRVLV